MKKFLLIILLLLTQINMSLATEKLPEINKNDSFLNMLSNRKTTRIFNPTKTINNNDLSNILWSAYGINRKEEGKRTIPTAMNTQDLEIYVIKKNGAYLYNAEKNELKQITKNNLFVYFTENQEFINDADIIILYTTKNYTKDVSALHAGSAYQNVAIYCAEHNMPNVVKGSMDRDGVAKELNLKVENILVGQAIGLN